MAVNGPKSRAPHGSAGSRAGKEAQGRNRRLGRSVRASRCALRAGDPALPCGALLLLFAIFLTGCASSPETRSAGPTPIEKTYETDNAVVHARVNRSELTVADRLDLVLEASATEDHHIEFPSPDEKLGGFLVVETRRGSPKLLEDGRVAENRTYVLEPFLPGDYTVPAMLVRFHRKADDASTDSKITIETEPISIRVTSVLPAADPSASGDDALTKAAPDIKEASGPVDLPGWPQWVYWVAGGAIVALLIGAIYFWRRRRVDGQTAVSPPLAHETASRALEQLLADRLVEAGDCKLFYLRLSNILRHYIEDRFALRAPESTTEEFLLDLRKDHRLDGGQRNLLRQFLEHCDLVKFAELEPASADIKRTVTTCRGFIDETKQQASVEPAESAEKSPSPFPIQG